MRRLVLLLRQREFHLFVFCLLLMLTNWPFLAISAHNGLHSMFRYIFVLWALVVLLLFLIQTTLREKPSGEDGDRRGGR